MYAGGRHARKTGNNTERKALFSDSDVNTSFEVHVYMCAFEP